MPNQQHSNKQKKNYIQKKKIYIYIYIQTKAIKTTNKSNKQTDRMFVHTPKRK
jgi:hypothetical protein